jgi:hypothetical protein
MEELFIVEEDNVIDNYEDEVGYLEMIFKTIKIIFGA